MSNGDCMDKTVSNAGPLIHLAEIGEFELLKVFSTIHIPEKVYEEVCIEGMPGDVEVRNAENIEVSSILEEELRWIADKISFRLDEGELHALSLCSKLEAEIFLTDDPDARYIGKRLGFEVHGSVGVIARAYRNGLIDLEKSKRALESLYSISKLFVTKAIIEEAIMELETFA